MQVLANIVFYIYYRCWKDIKHDWTISKPTRGSNVVRYVYRLSSSPFIIPSKTPLESHPTCCLAHEKENDHIHVSNSVVFSKLGFLNRSIYWTRDVLCLQVYKNRGSRAGASMTHSHSQLIALPVITHNVKTELQGAKEFFDKHNECIVCGVVKYETQSARVRLIDENEHFLTVSPYAPMFPYETWLVPKRHSSNYETISEDEVRKHT